jgi:hypothetical protein
MLANLWESTSIFIQSFGIWGIALVLCIAFFHPTFEAPAALFLLTLLTMLIDSVWFASFLLLMTYAAGFSFFYWLAHRLHRQSGFWLLRFKPTKEAMVWLDAQPTWKHILIIGMPLIYTYPLRVAFTLNHKSWWPYFMKTLGQYLVLTIGNLLLYFGLIEFIFLSAPWWVITIILLILAIAIYAIRSKRVVI